MESTFGKSNPDLLRGSPDKDFYRNGRNTRFCLVALRGKDLGILTLTIAHQTQSIFIKLQENTFIGMSKKLHC